MAISRNELNIIISARDEKMRRVFDRAAKRMERLETDARRNASRTSRHFDKMGRASRKAGDQISAAFPGVGAFSGATAGAVAFGAALTSIVRNGDKLVRLRGRLEAITGSSEKAASGVEGLSAIMIETGTDIDTASQSFTRFTQASKALGATQEEVLTLTDTLLKMGRIGGGSAQELQSGAIQLGQALASGQLRGDELRSVMENLPVVTEALADALGVGVGKLREMAEAGELTSRKVFDALLSKADETNDKFAKLPITVDMAAGKMSAAWTRFSAQIDDSIGLSRTLASVLDGIAAKFDRASLTGLDLVQAQIEEAEQRLSIKGPGGITVPEARKAAEAELMALRDVESQYLKNAAAMKRAETARKSVAAASAAPSGGSSRSGGGSAQAPLTERLDDVYGRSIDLLIQREELIGKTAEAQARLNAENTLRNRLEAEAGDDIGRDGVLQEIEELVQTYGELTAATYRAEEAERQRQRAAEEAQAQAQRAVEESKRATDDFVDGLFNARQSADSFKDALKQVGIQLAKLAASNFLKGLLGGNGSGVFGSLGSLLGSSSLGSLSFGFKNGGPVKAFASGGPVSGPGGPRSDSIPAMLSNGEYVVNAAAARRNATLLDAINGGRSVQMSQQHVHVTVDAGPEFDVKVQQASGAQTSAMIKQNDMARDQGFRTRFMATDSEIRKDLR